MFDRMAIVLLASGLSARFGADDKLLAPLGGKPVLSHATSALANHLVSCRIAVVGANQIERRHFVEARGYHVVQNPAPEQGQGRSLAIGLEHVRDRTDTEYVLILLGDMPFVPDDHLAQLAKPIHEGASAVMSESDGILSPPAMFARSTFDLLACMSGDHGARRMFATLDHTRTVKTDAGNLWDIDTFIDLQQAEQKLNG